MQVLTGLSWKCKKRANRIVITVRSAFIKNTIQELAQAILGLFQLRLPAIPSRLSIIFSFSVRYHSLYAGSCSLSMIGKSSHSSSKDISDNDFPYIYLLINMIIEKSHDMIVTSIIKFNTNVRYTNYLSMIYRESLMVSVIRKPNLLYKETALVF